MIIYKLSKLLKGWGEGGGGWRDASSDEEAGERDAHGNKIDHGYFYITIIIFLNI